MKKQALAAVIAATISMPSTADFLGVYAGLDYASNETSFSNSNGSEDDNNLSGYFAFEHFIPLVPNVKLKYSDLSNSDLNNNDSSAMNAILYYEVLDNDLVEIDLGLAYTDTESFNHDASIAQAYGAAKVHVPGVSMHAFAEVIGGSLTDDDALDAQIGLAYTFNPDSYLLNVAVRAGYRVQELEFDNVAGTQEVDGLFAGVEVHF